MEYQITSSVKENVGGRGEADDEEGGIAAYKQASVRCGQGQGTNRRRTCNNDNDISPPPAASHTVQHHLPCSFRSSPRLFFSFFWTLLRICTRNPVLGVGVAPNKSATPPGGTGRPAGPPGEQRVTAKINSLAAMPLAAAIVLARHDSGPSVGRGQRGCALRWLAWDTCVCVGSFASLWQVWNSGRPRREKDWRGLVASEEAIEYGLVAKKQRRRGVKDWELLVITRGLLEGFLVLDTTQASSVMLGAPSVHTRTKMTKMVA